ncbi:MAG TPA: tetraacyldisaccharide 4'-kinase [Acidobacteriaceae bacterium]|nr:tetraacyldisaccharide 4'-kinase [Acidobacteriaceae bacterium]
MNRGFLAPLVPLYTAGAAMKNAAYDRGWLRQRALADPVISVGNLSTGGAGKTPFVIYLAQQLQTRGFCPDVLSRGYGGSRFVHAEQVDPAGAASRYGDEPLMIARSTGIPVYVGERRLDAGLLAEADAGEEERVHLLDDGFQHRKLARTIDIVMLHGQDFTDQLLPAGNLREPLSSLKRAHVTVLRTENRGYADRVAEITGRAPWILTRSLRIDLTAARPLAFCGLARPQDFFGDLRAFGITPAAEITFPDHHRYTAADMRRLLDAAKSHGADALITTEKDEVKLPVALTETLQQSGKLAIARLVLSLENEARSIDELVALLA